MTLTAATNWYCRYSGVPTGCRPSVLGRGRRCRHYTDRHPQVPTCADRGCRGRRLRGAVPPVPRGRVGTKFAVQGHSEEVMQVIPCALRKTTIQVLNSLYNYVTLMYGVMELCRTYPTQAGSCLPSTFLALGLHRSRAPNHRAA
jgi:hypothetical protein